MVLTVVAGVLAVAGLASPSHASGAEFRVARDTAIVKYEGCRYYPVRYDVPDDVMASAYGWSLEVTFYDPRGIESDSDYLFDDEDPSSGNANAFICEDELAGAWTLGATLEWYDAEYNTHTLKTSDSFSVRKTATRTGIAVNDTTANYGQKLTFTVSSQKQFPNGFFAEPYTAVRLQKYDSGVWRTFASGTTNQYGKYRFSGYWKFRVAKKVRAVTLTTSVSAGSTSRVITIY